MTNGRYFAAQKLTGGLGKQRLIIKTFKTSQALHEFLNKQDNSWTQTDGTFGHQHALKAGTYAFAGGKWLNVKTLDAALLAHI